jgi:hypothetical protein
MVHCRTLRHVARLYLVDEGDLKAFMRDPEALMAPAERTLRQREDLKHETETEVGRAGASAMALAALVRDLRAGGIGRSD